MSAESLLESDLLEFLGTARHDRGLESLLPAVCLPFLERVRHLAESA
jgi:hypothetical protein